jgi:hypothetical protein
MSDDRPKHNTIFLGQATISNMWEIIAAIVERLSGLCSKHDLLDINIEKTCSLSHASSLREKPAGRE